MKKTEQRIASVIAVSPIKIALYWIVQMGALAMVSVTTQHWNAPVLRDSWERRVTKRRVVVVVAMGVALMVPVCVTVAGEETIARLNYAPTTVVHMERAKTRPDVFARMGFPEMVALSPQVVRTVALTMEIVWQSQVRRKAQNANAIKDLRGLHAKWKYALVRQLEKCAPGMDPATTRS